MRTRINEKKRPFNKPMKKNIQDTNIGYFTKDGDITTIYIGNLSYGMDEGDVKDLFKEYGRVNYVKLIKDTRTFRSKGIAFVQMDDRDKAELAISKLDGSIIGDRTVKVSIAKENVKGPAFRRRR